MLNEIIKPQLQSGEKKHVLITHGESHFMSMSDQKSMGPRYFETKVSRSFYNNNGV